jgi:hypothetical protein
MDNDAPEDPNNIDFCCEKCFAKMHPSKGKYTRGMLRYATCVLVAFGTEHMWIDVVALTHEGVVGTVANYPINKTSPAYGTKVTVKYSEVEDAN